MNCMIDMPQPAEAIEEGEVLEEGSKKKQEVLDSQQYLLLLGQSHESVCALATSLWAMLGKQTTVLMKLATLLNTDVEESQMINRVKELLSEANG